MGLDVLLLLIPVSFFMALVALGVFLWANHSGQFDDLDTPAIRVVLEETPDSDPIYNADRSQQRLNVSAPIPSLDN